MNVHRLTIELKILLLTSLFHLLLIQHYWTNLFYYFQVLLVLRINMIARIATY